MIQVVGTSIHIQTNDCVTVTDTVVRVSYPLAVPRFLQLVEPVSLMHVPATISNDTVAAQRAIAATTSTPLSTFAA